MCCWDSLIFPSFNFSLGLLWLFPLQTVLSFVNVSCICSNIYHLTISPVFALSLYQLLVWHLNQWFVPVHSNMTVILANGICLSMAPLQKTVKKWTCPSNVSLRWAIVDTSTPEASWLRYNSLHLFLLIILFQMYWHNTSSHDCFHHSWYPDVMTSMCLQVYRMCVPITEEILVCH